MWPKFLYESTELQFSNKLAIPYPKNFGSEYFINTLSHPRYEVTNRDYPTVSISLNSENVKSTDRDTIWSFWNTTLVRGEYDFTFIDDQKRFLFDVSWNQWKERWVKLRGGLHNITYDLLSPFNWTPPMFGCYPMAESIVSNNLTCHSLITADTLTVENGLTEGNTANVLRKNGVALYVTNASGSEIGARSSSLSWYQKKDSSSITLFCQVRCPQLATDKYVYIMYLYNGNNFIRLYAYRKDADEVYYSASWQKSGESSENLATGIIAGNIDTWYDIAVSYEALSGKIYFYIYPSAGASWASTNVFQYGATTATEYTTIKTVTNYPTNLTWTSLDLLNLYSGTVFSTTSHKAYIQNAMVIDAWISPVQFNTFRRLCQYWNNKTSQYPK